ncbi:MAG: hypothetical protein E7503_08965 [Ruminococcus sp.]|nr:hypothetical protein [Ruminococcus sp.]
MKRQLQTVFSVGIMAALTLTGGVMLLRTPRTYSENENRYLQSSAKPTWEGVLDGSWQEDITAYMSDQMPMRDTWTALQSKMQQWLGKKEIAGVYLGKDDFYFEKCTAADISHGRFAANVQAVAALAEALPQSSLYFLPAPTAGLICREALPSYAPYYDESGKMELAFGLLENRGCTVVDLRTDFAARTDSGEQLYYRTDHHWNTRGAFAAYEAFAQAAGLTAMTEEEADLKIISESFRGTLDAKVLDAAGPTDTVEVPFSLPKVQVTADGKPISVLEMSALHEKDQYKVFFGGNYGQVTVETAAGTGRSLLVFKDSYANCFVPFLLEHYDTVTMVDLRYNDGTWTELLAAAPDDVLVLYEMSNFCKDMNLSAVPSLLGTP